MSRYLVDTPARLALVRTALDQANGLRDAAGLPTTKTMYLVSGPASVDRDLEGNVTRVYGNVLATAQRGGTVTSEPILGDDGTAALALADDLDEIADHLGKTVRGVALPSRGALVTEAQLPARVKAEIERGRVIETLEKAMGLRAR
jgi:pimeloyl-ACP methyl ester carboxylesterase